MAEAAEQLTWLTRNQIIMTAGEVSLLILVLFFTVTATKHAARAADAANKTLAAERAWITFKMMGFGALMNTTLDGVTYKNAIGFAPTWHNTGRSPVINVSVTNMIEVIAIDADPDWAFDASIQPRQVIQSNLGVESTISGNMCHLDDAQSSAFRHRKIQVLLHSFVEYYDVFDPNKKRTSEASLRFIHAGGTVVRDGRAESELPILTNVFGSQNRIT